MGFQILAGAKPVRAKKRERQLDPETVSNAQVGAGQGVLTDHYELSWHDKLSGT